MGRLDSPFRIVFHSIKLFNIELKLNTPIISDLYT